jgi:hypothetical protein
MQIYSIFEGGGLNVQDKDERTRVVKRSFRARGIGDGY